MRKILASIVLLCLVLCLASCGQEHTPVGPAPQPDPVPEPDPVVAPKEYAKALNDQKTAVEFLTGEWRQCPMGVIRDDEVTTTIEFDDELKAVITRDDGEFALCDYRVTTLMEDEDGSIDLITLIPYEVSKDLFEGNMDYYIGETAMFQFLACRAEGKDLLLMREPGNGESAIGYWVFGYNLLAGDTNTWIFCRDNDVAPRDHDETVSLRKKNSTFFAYSWCSAADFFMIQELEGVDFYTTFYEDELYVVLMMYAVNDHPLEAVFYDYVAIPGEGDMAMSDILQPMFGIVTTDEDGIITDFEQLDYIGYGVYSMGYVPKSYPISITEEDGSVMDEYPRFEECMLTGSDECIQMRITANETVRDLSVVSLSMDEMNETGPHWITEELYHLNSLTPDAPLVLTTPYLMDLPTYGILLHDSQGQEHLYEIWQSGKDGSLQISESTDYE